MDPIPGHPGSLPPGLPPVPVLNILIIDYITAFDRSQLDFRFAWGQVPPAGCRGGNPGAAGEPLP